MKKLAVDKALYLVDDNNKSYRFLKRNSNWQSISAEQNYKNKKSLDGYTRHFRNGKTKVFKFNVVDSE
jgi:hypothetical protein